MRRLPAAQPRKPVWEIAYVLFALFLLSGSLTPLIYDFFGRNRENDADSNPIRLLMLLGVYGIALLLALKDRQKAVEVIKSAPVVLIVLALPAVSAFWSVDPVTTLKRAAAFTMTGVFCLYLATRFRGEELLRLLLWVFFVGAIACFIYAPLFPEYGIHLEPPNTGNWQGIYGHKNELGRAAVIALLAAAACVPTNTFMARMRLATLGLFLILLLLSGSRTNWFILLGSAALVPALMVMRSQAIDYGLRMAMVVIAALVLLIAVYVLKDQLLEATGRGESLSGRLTLWRGVGDVIAAKYPIFGAGYGTFFTNAGAVPDLQPYLVYWGGVPNHAHNGYLNTQADLGYPGLVVLAVFLVSLTFLLLKLLLAQPKRRVWLCYAGLVFAFLINNYTESTAFKHSDLMWVLMIVMYFQVAAEAKKVALVKRARMPSRGRRIGVRAGARPGLAPSGVVQ